MTIIVYPELLTTMRRKPRSEPTGEPSVARAFVLGICYLLVVAVVALPAAVWAGEHRVNLYDEYRAGYAVAATTSPGSAACPRAVAAAFPSYPMSAGGLWFHQLPREAPADVTAFWMGCEQRRYGQPEDPSSLRWMNDD